jgi:hypothetical protein
VFDFYIQKPENKKSDGPLEEAARPKRARNAAALYPSTVGSGQLSLLCEASLTLCLP